MKYILLFIVLTSSVLAQEIIHSSISTYYENKTFSNSAQKYDGVVYGIGGDIHHNDSEYKFAYEHGDTNTIKSPKLTEDLKTDKIFLKYAYSFNETFEANIHYINILNDNLAITDGGVAYGAGLTYNFNKKIALNFTQFYSDYETFNMYQSDLKLDFKTKIQAIKMKLSFITKYIVLDEEKADKFTEFAQDDYLTGGIKFHAHYNTYHLGAGAYFGKRLFAIMDDGFKIQHHSMEFDRTYAIGLGKSISDFVIRFQYIYQRAEELPFQNGENVDVDNLRIIANYKF